MLRLLLLGLLVVGALAVVVEQLVERRVPRVAAERLGRALGLPVEVVAAGRGRDWLRTRRLSVVSLTTHHVPIRGGAAELDRLDVLLRGVRLEGRGGDRHLVADAGEFTATIGQDQLRRLLDLPPLVRSLEVRGDRVRFVTTGGLNVDVRLSAEAHAIVLAPVANPLPKVLPVRLRIPLDELPAGAHVQRAVVRDGAVVASGSLDGARLHAPSAG